MTQTEEGSFINPTMATRTFMNINDAKRLIGCKADVGRWALVFCRITESYYAEGLANEYKLGYVTRRHKKVTKQRQNV